jgi:hypothetical protein
VKNADEFPVVYGYLQWAKKRHEEGATVEQIVSLAVQRYGASPAILESLVMESLRMFAHRAVAGDTALAVEDHEPKPVEVASVDNPPFRHGRLNARKRAEIVARVRSGVEDDAVARFFERHPDTAVEVPLLSMTREELLVAAQIRDTESVVAHRRATLCREIASRLQPGQVASDVVSEEEAERIANRILHARISDIRRAG